MGTIRIPEAVWSSIVDHLFSQEGEHFAFLLADWTYSRGEPVFMVRDVILIPDAAVRTDYDGMGPNTDAILNAVNAAVKGGRALIEAHNHGGNMPRFSTIDRRGLSDFAPYVLDSLPGRPYAATVWGQHSVYGEYVLPTGMNGRVGSVTVIGRSLSQIVSLDDDQVPVSKSFQRQLPWFTPEGQRQLARYRIAVAGCGGTGCHVIQQLAYLGVRNLILVDRDSVDDTNLNRLVTATPADVGTPKAYLGRSLVRGLAHDARVLALNDDLRSPAAIDGLKGADVIFGCLDNDGGRLFLNELALAYGIPYFDLASGVDAGDGKVSEIGGRVCVIVPGGPCLNCMGEIDPHEAGYHLGTREQQAIQVQRGYVRGMDTVSPSVVSINGAVAAMAVNEFAVFVSGIRPVSNYIELDLLGKGRPLKSQWMTPRRVDRQDGCVQCLVANQGDKAAIERYIRV
jgi:molybdopterin/thiamine biosynthesis adenylyltransferase